MTGGLKLGLAAVAGLLVMVALFRSCVVPEPLVVPDWADSLRAVQQEYQRERDSLHLVVDANRMVADSAKRTSETWRLRSLATRPTRPVPNLGTNVPNSGTHNNVDVIPDSASVIAHLQAVNDSLWTAIEAADSAYSTLDRAYHEQRQATAAALAWKDLEAARADSTEAVASLAITDLTGRLQKAQRGCRVLGLLPCPTLSVGYGATLANGKILTGPTVGISVPMRF